MTLVHLVKIMTAICLVESGGNSSAVNTSDPTVAVGYCQLRRVAAKDAGFQGELVELLDKDLNFLIATRYFKVLHKRAKGDTLKAITAYNSGKYLTESKYLTKVKARYKLLYRSELK